MTYLELHANQWSNFRSNGRTFCSYYNWEYQFCKFWGVILVWLNCRCSFYAWVWSYSNSFYFLAGLAVLKEFFKIWNISMINLGNIRQSTGSSHALFFTLGTIIITFRVIAIIISFYRVPSFLDGWNIEVLRTGMKVSHLMLASILVTWMVSYLRTFSFAMTGKAFLRMEIESFVVPDFSDQFTPADCLKSCDSTWVIESCKVRKTQSDAIGTLPPV